MSFNAISSLFDSYSITAAISKYTLYIFSTATLYTPTGSFLLFIYKQIASPSTSNVVSTSAMSLTSSTNDSTILQVNEMINSGSVKGKTTTRATPELSKKMEARRGSYVKISKTSWIYTMSMEDFCYPSPQVCQHSPNTYKRLVIKIALRMVEEVEIELFYWCS